MDEHLTKPIQLDQLRHVLRHWLTPTGDRLSPGGRAGPQRLKQIPKFGGCGGA